MITNDERGIESIKEWCLGAMEGADGALDGMLCDILGAIEEYEHPELARADTVRSVDRETLLKLADEMVEMFRIGAFTGEGIDRSWCRELYDKYAKRVREACGVNP